MIYKSEYGNINVSEIGKGKKVSIPQELSSEPYTRQNTVQVSFKGKKTQFQFLSFDDKLNDEGLIQALRYFIFRSLYSEKGYEAFCAQKWGVWSDEANTVAGRKKYLKDFKMSNKIRLKAKRIGITPDMAWDIDKRIDFDVMRIRKKNN